MPLPNPLKEAKIDDFNIPLDKSSDRIVGERSKLEKIVRLLNRVGNPFC